VKNFTSHREHGNEAPWAAPENKQRTTDANCLFKNCKDKRLGKIKYLSEKDHRCDVNKKFRREENLNQWPAIQVQCPIQLSC